MDATIDGKDGGSLKSVEVKGAGAQVTCAKGAGMKGAVEKD